jgi:hypothetical protein
VIADFAPIQCLGDEPRGRFVEDRHPKGAGTPGATPEFVVLIDGCIGEEFGQPMAPPRQYVHRKVLELTRQPEAVAVVGDTDEKSRGPRADLGGKADQTTRWLAIGLGGHDEHRVVQHRHELIKRFIVHTNIMHRSHETARSNDQSTSSRCV